MNSRAVSTEQKSPEVSLLQAEAQKIFQDALKKLNVQEKLVLKMHFKYGRTLEDIRKALKMSSIWKVHRTLKKAVYKLSKELEKKDLTYEQLLSDEEMI
jgi:RNA polymerase sigma factor (sigma-70 family)